jgi:hypothetical protein
MDGSAARILTLCWYVCMIITYGHSCHLAHLSHQVWPVGQQITPQLHSSKHTAKVNGIRFLPIQQCQLQAAADYGKPAAELSKRWG